MKDRPTAVGSHLTGGETTNVASQLASAIDSDYTTSIVPANKRRADWKMAIVWGTLLGALVNVTIGYAARSQGLSLGQQIGAGLLAAAIALVYGVGAANLGALTGQTHTLLTRTIFGRAGSAVVSVLLIIQGMAFYSLAAFFLVQVLQGFIPLNPGPLWAAIFAILMTFNNLFGFRGVTAFALWLGTPLLIGWGIWTVIKGFATVPGETLFSSPDVEPTTTVLIMTSLIVGGLMWGNEPDFFRYSKARPWYNVPTLIFGYLLGALIFPVAGYLMAELSGAADLGAQMRFLVDFSLFGLTAVGILVFVVNIVASNDGNLYEAINPMQNLFGWNRVISVLILGAVGALVASRMESLQQAIFIVFGISATVVPCATIIMVMDYFLAPRLFGLRRPMGKVTPWSLTGAGNWVGIVALVIGVAVGTLTGGLIPGLPGFGKTSIGIPPLQGWSTAAILYLLGLLLVRGSALRFKLLGYPIDYEGGEVSPAVVSTRA